MSAKDKARELRQTAENIRRRSHTARRGETVPGHLGNWEEAGVTRAE